MPTGPPSLSERLCLTRGPRRLWRQGDRFKEVGGGRALPRRLSRALCVPMTSLPTCTSRPAPQGASCTRGTRWSAAKGPRRLRRRIAMCFGTETIKQRRPTWLSGHRIMQSRTKTHTLAEAHNYKAYKPATTCRAQVRFVPAACLQPGAVGASRCPSPELP